jgi:hypothetical protein
VLQAVFQNEAICTFLFPLPSLEAFLQVLANWQFPALANRLTVGQHNQKKNEGNDASEGPVIRLVMTHARS